ncbi:MAG TPA: GNAT family N-acetyltransferase [Xanthomonadales bacterium]|nr:GNAT family N-acetyltransferase [Xanthomonadales bacterium]
MTHTPLIRQMSRPELEVLVGWAAKEGWNPGRNDADVFWTTDPEAFIAAELDGKMIGGLSIVSCGGAHGFMGIFIVHPDYRSQGIGNHLWHERLRRLVARLNAPVTIGMDGVFDMQAWYARGGFRFSTRDLRFEVTARDHAIEDHVVDLSTLPFSHVDAYDRRHFPAPRSKFLKLWISAPGHYARGVFERGELVAYGVLRPCVSGSKIGPLFANRPDVARDVFHALCSEVPGQPVFLDVPENNPHAMVLAQAEGMEEVFGCAKMYYGPAPVLPDHEIFGVTTFELG